MSTKEPTFTVTAAALTALVAAVNDYLANKQAATKLLSSIDPALSSAWQVFEKTLTPVVDDVPEATTDAPTSV